MVARGSDRKVGVTVELFGMPRLATGRKAMALELTGDASLRELVAALARTCPDLVGKAIRPDLSGLMDGYILNLNGATFVDRLETRVSPGDSVLLLSDQAGG